MRIRAIIPAALMMSSIFTLSACRKDKAEASKPLNEITADVMECGVEFPEMVEVSEENFQIKYGLTQYEYEEFSLWWAGSGADADEVCIIKAKDKEKVKLAVEERLDGQKDVFKDYVPEEYDKLCDTQVKTKGDYVYWLCTNDNEKAEEVLKSDFK